MTVAALGTPVTAEAFVIASEPAPNQPRVPTHAHSA